MGMFCVPSYRPIEINGLIFLRIWSKDSSVDESLRKLALLTLNMPLTRSVSARDFHLRLSVKSSEEADVWILLTRHITDTKNRQDEYISLDVQDEDEAGVTSSGQSVSYHRCETRHVLLT
jgi:hypothetical protein